jgi:hypothetical protein
MEDSSLLNSIKRKKDDICDLNLESASVVGKSNSSATVLSILNNDRSNQIRDLSSNNPTINDDEDKPKKKKKPKNESATDFEKATLEEWESGKRN